MAKKIAVMVRERQNEALRMAVGIILLDDVIDVYVLDRKVADSGDNGLYLETIKDLEMSAYSNVKENDGLEYLSNKEIAARLVGYDHVLAY